MVRTGGTAEAYSAIAILSAPGGERRPGSARSPIRNT